MLSNDTLTVQFFATSIPYGDTSTTPVASVTIVFPPTPMAKPLNIAQWITLVNQTFAQTAIELPLLGEVKLDSVLSLDWTFFPYTINAVYDKTWIFKSVLMKNVNSSSFYVRFLGSPSLLQFFGKDLAGGPLPSEGGGMSYMMGKTKKQQAETMIKDEMKNEMKMRQASDVSKVETKVETNKVEDKVVVENLDMNLQQMFGNYATRDPNVQITLTMDTQNAELIIDPDSVFKGFLDGFTNDNLCNFSVGLDSSEQWVYHNADQLDAHPFHQHLTSSFVAPNNPQNSPGLVSRDRAYDGYLYSKSILGISPQQSLGFYLRFVNFSSLDSTRALPFKGLGFMVHCHIQNHSSAGMLGQYFVFPGKRSEWFGE